MYWEEDVNVSHLHSLYSAGTINLVALAKGMVGRLKSVKYYAIADPEFMDVVMEFNSIDAMSGYEDYCIAFDYLIDFADRDNRLWVETDKPTDKADMAEDDIKVRSINVKMLDEYPDEYMDPIQASYSGPYAPGVSIVKATPATSSSATGSSTPARRDRRKSVRFLSEYEFESRLKAKGIDPRVLSKEFATFVKEVDDDFQAWIMTRFIENGGRSINPKPEPKSRVRSRGNSEVGRVEI